MSDKQQQQQQRPVTPSQPSSSSGEPVPDERPPSSSSSVSDIVLWSSDSSTVDDDSGDSEKERRETAESLLNFSSSRFSPTLALKCKDMEGVPVKEGVRKYLNLQQYSKAIESPSKSPHKNVAPVKQLTVADLMPKKKPETNEPVASTSTSSSTPAEAPPHYPIPGRRFLPHQMPTFRPRKEHPNTLTLMRTTEGPLSVLNLVMTHNTRVKIWTRNDKGFRGFLTGFVEAFDKHWNIALRDVDEQFVRRKAIKFPIFGDNIIPEENEEKEDWNNKKENTRKAISATFIRLQNYLRQNEVKKGISTFTDTTHTAIKKSTASKEGSYSSSRGRGQTTTTRSKTVYVGGMDPLAICRTGLAKLSLRDDEQDIIHQEKKDSFKSSRKKTPPDVVQCHQISNVGGGEPSSSSVASRPPAPSLPVPTTFQQQTSSFPSPRTRTSLKKKSLTVFKTPYEDNFGFMVVAQTKKYELVERHVGQVLLMGNDIVFIETSNSGC